MQTSPGRQSFMQELELVQPRRIVDEDFPAHRSVRRPSGQDIEPQARRRPATAALPPRYCRRPNSVGRSWHECGYRVFRHGPVQAGCIEGRNVTIEYRWAEGEYNRFLMKDE